MVESTLDLAKDYANRGWRVIPIKSGTKRPALNDWVNAATTSHDTIEKWWTANDVGGVGIVTGPKTGFFVLDVDVADGKYGDESLSELESSHGKLPDTVEVITGSGGRHLYYAWPEGRAVATSGGKLGPGLDIRGEGGQVVAPGSRHPQTGNLYEWEASSHPDHIPIAQAPEWLLELLEPDPLSQVEYRDHQTTNLVAYDNFNLNATNDDVRTVLELAGWKLITTDKAGAYYMARPGKDDGGFSASIGKVRQGVLYVFSENAPGFRPNMSYDPIWVLANSLCDGDAKRADEYLTDLGNWGIPTVWPGDDAFQQWVDHCYNSKIERSIQFVEASTHNLAEVWGHDFKIPKPTALARSDGRKLSTKGESTH